MIDLSMIDQSPMLIGGMTSSVIYNNQSCEYVPEVLLIDDVLVRTNEILEFESLFYELILFKEESDEYVRYLVSIDFFDHHRLDCISVIEIRSKYCLMS